jgi:acetylornithine aminotransferase
VNHLRQAALERGLLINVTQDKVIRLLPPLIIDPSQAEQIVDGVCALIDGLDG